MASFSKTVLMICPFAKPNLGGVETHLDKLTNYLVNHSYRVFLLTYQPLTTRVRGESIEKRGNLEIHRVGWVGNGWFTKLEPFFPLVFLYLFPGLFGKCLIFYLRRHREVDCIHAHGLVAAAIAKILANIHRKRTVISTHAIYHFENRKILARLNKWLLGSADSILAVGEPSRQELISIGLDSKKIRVHPNWIDVDLYCPLDRTAIRSSLGTSGVTVLFVGRLLEKKGVLLLLQAAKILPHIQFIIAGDGPMKDAVVASASQNANVNYVGSISDAAKLVAYYNAADVFVSLPLYDEGFAGVYLEALACGTPVIASNRGCLPDFLERSVAMLIEPTVENLTQSLSALSENNCRSAELRKQCRQYALEHFGEKNVQVIVASYEDSRGN